MRARLNHYERVSYVIWHLNKVAPMNRRSLSDIAHDLDLAYSSVRDTIKKHYPHCFEERDGIGWFITGVQPIPDMPFDFNEAPSLTIPIVQPVVSQPVPQPVGNNTTGKWRWNQEAINYLNTMWPGRKFDEVLKAAYEAGTIDDIIVLGKTMARAAEMYKRNPNASPYR